MNRWKNISSSSAASLPAHRSSSAPTATGSSFSSAKAFTSSGISSLRPSAVDVVAHNTGEDRLDSLVTLGMDVDMDEESTRRINSESEASAERTKQVKASISKEKVTAKQLSKDDAYARTEMDSHLRKAKEMQDDAAVNGHLRETLEQSLRSSVVQLLADSNNEAISNGDKENQSSKTGTGGSTSSAAPAIERVTSKKFLQIKNGEVTELSSVVEKETMKQTKKKMADLNEEITMLQQTIVTENLEAILRQKRAETEARRQELESEKLRKQQIRTAIRELRAKSERNALGLAAKRKILEANKKKFAAERKEKQQELEQAEAELCSVKTQEEWDKELAEAEKERDSAAQVIAQAQAMIAKRDTSKEEREGVESAVRELKTTQQELVAKIEARKESLLVVVQAELDKAKQDAVAVADERLENNEYQAKIVWPAESALKDIIEDKEKYTKAINGRHEAIKMDADKVKATKQKDNEKLEALQEESSLIQLDLDETTTELNVLVTNKDEEVTVFETEARELRSLIDSLDCATDVERTTLDEKTKENEDETKNCQHALQEAKEACIDNERHLKILEGGAEHLETRDKRLAGL